MKNVTIWHTADIHSRYELFSGISRYVNTHRKSSDLFLDAGDFCDFYRPLVNGTNGLGSIEILKQANVDVLCAGNNEFLASDKLLAAMSDQGLPIICCNLKYKEKKENWRVRPSMILEREGVRFLVIGCCPYWPGTLPTDFLDRVGLYSVEPIPCIQEEITKNEGQYDVAILLSHAGIRFDRKIAEQIPQIDIICGGHTHLVMEEPEIMNGVFIHHVGCYAEYLDQIDIQLDKNNHVINISAQKIANDFETDPVMNELVMRLEHEGRSALAVELFNIGKVLHFEPYHECVAVNAVCDAMYETYDADLAMINNSILVRDLGPSISKLELLERSPSGLMPTTVYWYGQQIYDAFIASLDPKRTHGSGKGAGNRAPFLGSISFSHNVHIKGNHITINGEPLVLDRLYAVVTSDYLQRGSGYEMLGLSKTVTVYHQGYIRDLLAEKLQDTHILEEAKIIRYEK